MESLPPNGTPTSTSGRPVRRGSIGNTIGRWMRPGKGSNHSKSSTPEHTNTDALDVSIASGSSRRHLSEHSNDESSKLIEIDSLTSSPSTDAFFRNNTTTTPTNNNNNRRNRLRGSFNNINNNSHSPTEEEDVDSDAPFRMDDILAAAPNTGRRRISLKPARNNQSSNLLMEDSDLNVIPSSGKTDSASTLESSRQSSGQIPPTIDSSVSQSSERIPPLSPPKSSGAEEDHHDEHDDGEDNSTIESPLQDRRNTATIEPQNEAFTSDFLNQGRLANPRSNTSTPLKKLSSRRKLSQPSSTTGPSLLQPQASHEQKESSLGDLGSDSEHSPEQPEEPPTRRADNFLADLELKPPTNGAQSRQPLRQKLERRPQQGLLSDTPSSTPALGQQQVTEQQTSVKAEELLQDMQIQPPATTAPHHHQPAPQPAKSAMRKNKKEIDPDIPQILNIDLSDDNWSDDDEDTFAVETVATEEPEEESVCQENEKSSVRRSRPDSPPRNDSPPRRVNRTFSSEGPSASSSPPQPLSQRRRLRPHQHATNNVKGILHRENPQPQRPNLVGSKQAEISQRARIMEYNKPPEAPPVNPIGEDMFLLNPNRQRPPGATALSERRRMRQKPMDTGIPQRAPDDRNRIQQYEVQRGYQDNDTVVQANRMAVRPVHANQYQTASLMADQRSNSIGNISMGSVGEISAVTNDLSMGHDVSSSHMSMGTNMSLNTGMMSTGMVSNAHMSASTNNSGGNRASASGLSEAEEQALEEKLMRIAIEQSLAESQGAPVVPDPLGLSQHNSPTPNHFVAAQPPTTNYYQGVNQPMANHPISPQMHHAVSPPTHTNYYPSVQQPPRVHQPAVVPINHGISPPLNRAISQPIATNAFQPPLPNQPTPVARIDNFGPAVNSGPGSDTNQTDPATAARLAEIEEENRMLEIAIQQSLRDAEAVPTSVPVSSSYHGQPQGLPPNFSQMSLPTRQRQQSGGSRSRGSFDDAGSSSHYGQPQGLPPNFRQISPPTRQRQQSGGSRSRGSFDDTSSNRSNRGRLSKDSSNRSILSRDSSNRSILSRESSNRSIEAGMDDVVPASVTQNRVTGRSGRVRLRHL